ncbi:MAG: hypothetical protein WBV28_18290, partial [Terracidiphilus sp.]
PSIRRKTHPFGGSGTLPALATCGRTAWGALIVSGFAFVLNGDLPWSLFLMELNRHSQLPTDSAARPINFLLNAPVPLTLLAMGGFYLWVYARSSIQQKESNEQIALGGS